MKQKILFPLTIILLFSFILSGCSSSMMTAEGWPGLTVAENTIYLAYSNNVRAVDIDNGAEIWKYPEESKITFFAQPAISDEFVIVGDYNNTLHAIDKKTGVEQWAFTGAKSRWVGGALVFNDTIFAPCADHQLYILDMNGKKLSAFSTQQALWATPVSNGSQVIFPSMDHYLYAIDPESFEEVWKTDLAGALVASPVLDDAGILYIGTLAKEVYAIDSSSGKLVWNSAFSSDGSVWATILEDKGTLYFGDAIGNFYALDAQTGKQLWKQETGSPILASAASTPNGVIVPLQSGEIVQYSTDGKKKAWANIAESSLYTTPAISDDVAIFAINKGANELIAYDLDGSEIWSSSYQEK